MYVCTYDVTNREIYESRFMANGKRHYDSNWQFLKFRTDGMKNCSTSFLLMILASMNFLILVQV